MIFHIGDKVYPIRVDGNRCDATRQEMSRLYGIVVGIEGDGNSREYNVEWLDIYTNEPAKFDHGLKNAWFEESELTDFIGDYIDALDRVFDEDDGDDDIDQIVNQLCDVVDDELGHLCEEYNLDPCEYADTIIKQLCNHLLH